MKKFVSLAIVIALSAAIAPADAQTVPTTTNVNAPQSSNQGVSNPVGENTNVQVNNSYSGMNSFGVGIQCATPYFAAGVYNNNTDITGGGNINTSNAGGNNTTGATLQFVVPVGGTQGSNCTALSNEIVKQRQLDTQITLIQRCAEFAKAGITLDAHVFPQLASVCAGVKVAATATNATPAAPMGNDEAAAQLPKLVVYSSDTKAPQAAAPPAPIAATLAQAPACMAPKVLNDRDKALLEQWKMSSEHQNSALQKSLTKKYRAELAADCIDAVAWVH